MATRSQKNHPAVAGYTTRTHAPDLLNQLVLGERGLESLNLVALAPQDLLAADVDILQKQDLNVLSVEGLERLGGAATGDGAAPAAGRGVEGGSGRAREVLAPAVGDGPLE